MSRDLLLPGAASSRIASPCGHQRPSRPPLPVLPPLLQFEPSYEHIDFTWGIDACVRIYPAVLQLLQRFSAA